MATVRKRHWTSPNGEKKSAWVLSYMDRDGTRHRPQFVRKADAEAERVRIEGEMARGVHVPDRDSITVLDAAKAWLADFEDAVEAGQRERSTLGDYDAKVNVHIKKYPVASVKLSRLSGPDCKAFARALEKDLSAAMAPRVMTVFRRIVEYARGEGWIATNPARGIKLRTATDRLAADDEDAIKIPAKAQLRALFEAAETANDKGRALAMLHVLTFGGLRASEMRGLRRRDLHLDAGEIDVRQRADQWQVIGATKTKNSRRTVPIPRASVVALKTWLLAAPPSDDDLIFPNGAGKAESYTNIYHRIWSPLMEAAGLATVETIGKRKIVRPNFALHTLRHVAVSLWIEQKVEPKQIQEWAGHASITFTLDRYGHLWPNHASAADIVKAAEKSLLG